MELAVLRHAKIRELSHSSRGTLKSCPRKYELAKLSSGRREDTIHTAFGTALGAGIQTWFGADNYIPAAEKSRLGLGREEAAILAAFLTWKVSLFDHDAKTNKTFADCIWLIRQFHAMCMEGELPYADYELIGAEVGFNLLLPDGFRYRGFIDLVVRSPEGMVGVLEIKSTGKKFTIAADWRNQGQALAYSLVLPSIVPGVEKYTTDYLVWLTPLQKLVQLPFVYTATDKLDFVQDLLAECKVLAFYESLPRFPMDGSSCSSFGRECDLFGLCQLPTEKLVNTRDVALEDESKYQYVIDLRDI